MKVLVVGGAGYIGSHMVKLLSRKGCDVTVLDDLSAGYRDAVLAGELVEKNFGDGQYLDQLFSEKSFDAVMHFASHIQVGESLENPAKYYSNNVANTSILLDAMVAHNIDIFIFSSTAAIFGEPQYTPIDEAHPKEPINPYGRTKLVVEQMLADYARAYGVRFACLRYFNAAGADPEGDLGERHQPETHLIPLILQTASRRRKCIRVFGTDYDTQDGSCIRDYIHISDLADAHWLALEKLVAGIDSLHLNLGNGQGFSVLEVIEMARKVCGLDIPVEYVPRRAGDPAVLVADATRAKSLLGWQPKFGDLEAIVSHAWLWEQKQNQSERGIQ